MDEDDKIAGQIMDLLELDQLEARGDLSNWRYSELRLPRK